MYLASRHQVRAITNMMDDKWHDCMFGVNQSAVINVGLGTPCCTTLDKPQPLSLWLFGQRILIIMGRCMGVFGMRQAEITELRV